MKVSIVGGGVIGLCTAWYLQKSGYEVTVIEKGNLEAGCSFGNMGYVSPSHFIPLASPGIIAKGLRWMMNSSSPFYIRPRLNADLIRWGYQFWRSSGKQQMQRGTYYLNELLQLSRALMTEIHRDLGGNFEMIEKGCWMLYKNERTGDHEKHLAAQAEKLGLKTIICDAAAVQERETEVEVDVAGGVLYLDDCHVHPRHFMERLYQALRKAGVKFFLHTQLTGVEKKDGKVTALITPSFSLDCDTLVVANGSWMAETARQLGIALLMQPGKGYSLVYEDLEKNLQYPSILVDDRTATTPINKWLRIGGTMELSGHDDRILPKRVMAIYQAFKKYYPTLQLPVPEPSKAWFGYRPVTPDGLPYIGQAAGLKNVIFAGGHAMLGMSAAAGTARLVEEMIAGKKTSIDTSGFRVDRFS